MFWWKCSIKAVAYYSVIHFEEYLSVTPLNYSESTGKLIAMTCKPVYDVLTIIVKALNSQDPLVGSGLHSSR